MRYFRQNIGVPFVIVFQILLLSCAVLLNYGYPNLTDTAVVISGYPNFADKVAVYAYCSLVIGVVLQLVSFLRHGEGVEETEA